MTNFEVIVKNNPGYLKEVIASLTYLDDLKRATTGELKHDGWYDVQKDKCEMDFLNAEYVAPILDTIEKEYLGNIIRPFKNKIQYISKEKDSFGCCYILIKLIDEHLCLPYFSEKSGMYRGMTAKVRYTLEELGL